MWFVPTRGRPHRLQKFLDGCVSTQMTMPGLIVIDGDDGGDYSKVVLPDNWRIRRGPVRLDVGGRLDEILQQYPNEGFYSIVNDDIVPETPFWDTSMALEAGEWNVAYPNDCLQGEKMATQFMIGGKLARAVGSLSLGFRHGKMDRAWMEIGAALGRLRYRDDIRLRHEHFSNGLAPRDATYNRSYDGINTVRLDGLRWKSWEAERPALIERLKEVVPCVS